jgi:hypothetical protein
VGLTGSGAGGPTGSGGRVPRGGGGARARARGSRSLPFAGGRLSGQGGHFREMSGTVEGPRRPDYVGVRPPPAGRRRRDRGRTRARSTPAGILR